MITRYFISDDVRQEINGKVTLSGLYPDNVVVVNELEIERLKDENNKDLPYAIDRLTFSINTSKITGPVEFKAQFIDPEGNTHGTPAQLGKTEILEGQSFNVILQTSPFPFKIGGQYNIKFEVNDNVETLPFEIRIANSSNPPTKTA